MLQLLDLEKGLFRKRTGRDRTSRMFWSYVKNFIVLVVLCIITMISLEPSNAVLFIILYLVMDLLFGFYGMLSLRLRKIEERLEGNRSV